MEEKILPLLDLPRSCRQDREHSVICALPGADLTGNNRNYQRMYDRLAPFYDIVTALYARVRDGGEKRRVMQYLSALSVRDGDRVVEISVGTGRNIRYLNPNAYYCGVDISRRMLMRCSGRMQRLGRKITLIQAEAENLPIKSDSFDVVFSVGGFNFFNDREKAVREMLRIAKSGSTVMISDETEKVRSKYDRTPFARNFYRQPEIRGPVDFVPEGCSDVSYREICGGELYVLTFRRGAEENK